MYNSKINKLNILINSLPYKYWDIKTQIEYIQRRIIIYCIIYYELNDNIVEDKTYDEFANYLVELKNKYPDVYKTTEYYYCLRDFDKSTGFYIYDKLNEHDKVKLMNIAKYVLRLRG